MSDLYWQEESTARQQSRIRWLRDKDANTTFFHASIKARPARNTIRNLEVDGRLINDPLSIGRAFHHKYSMLFNQCKGSCGIPQGLLKVSIMEEENRCLCTLATMDELREVVRKLSSNRAPGMDGFNGAFYKATWHLISKDLLEAVNNVLQSNHLLAQVNHTILCLVPKKIVPVTVEDYRPIALCNVIYRIISKLLSTRLKPLLPGIIGPNQSAFIKGRRITDSILLAHELCHSLHSNVGRAHMCIKIDLSQAFDSLNRTFLCEALQRLAFKNKWIDWVSMCLNSTFSLRINGELTSPSSTSIGVRQGDPLSPYLFVIAM